ncbi:MAG: hypothetical protein Q9M97_02345 [Candidatus Gracilibacteria bacterium]|nr:hypothetical protein [Candidatus Gracilibacteria bacterium]
MDIIKKYFLEKINLDKTKLLEIKKSDNYLEQKKIFNLEGRIENARNSFEVGKIEKENSNILLIDDVIDSGATLNSIATKIKENNKVNQIIGLGGIGSLKGIIKITDI